MRWGYQKRLRRVLALWGPLFVIAALTAVIAAAISRPRSAATSADERYDRAVESGDSALAERAAWDVLRQRPSDLRAWVRFLDAHAESAEDADDADEPVHVVSERDVRRLLGVVKDARVRTIASYWYAELSAEEKPDPAEVTRLADSKPPAHFANYILGRAAMKHKDWQSAATRFEREGLAFGDAERSLRYAFSIWSAHDAWREIGARIDDPRYAKAVDARLRLELAEESRDWIRIAIWSWPAQFAGVSMWPLALAAIAGVLWFTIAGRMGRIQDGVAGRAVLYGSAFLLGLASVYPTVLTIIAEERVFGLRELGQFVPDLIYFTFGVGLREETWKAVLFLPLLPALLRRASRIEAMTCGALVGLGFAAEENILYLHHYGAGVALPRFLSANFLHMSLTALVALATFDTIRGRAQSSDRFNMVFPLAVAIHGAYDFLLTTNDMPLSGWMSMLLFIIIARQFLRQLLIASSREEERGLLNLLVASLALITGTAYIYATTLAGPWAALRMISVGGLGVIIVIWMFVRELSPA